MSQQKSGGITALVLAGQRDGRLDPLAEAAGTRFKALSPVAGRPMILHVLDALDASPLVERILVSINAGAGLEALPEMAALIAAGRLRITASRSNLVDSVIDALEGAAYPVLVTTADNVLLTPEAIDDIASQARGRGVDVAVAFARRADIRAAHPEGQRKFYEFADDAYSTCNAYWIGNPAALHPVEVFRSGGQFVKYPMRIIGAFGLMNLIRFRYGIGTLDALFQRLSRRFGLVMRPAIVRDGAVAIDVDNARTLGVAEELLARRARATPLSIAAE